MKLISLLQLFNKFQQVGKIDNLSVAFLAVYTQLVEDGLPFWDMYPAGYIYTIFRDPGNVVLSFELIIQMNSRRLKRSRVQKRAQLGSSN